MDNLIFFSCYEFAHFNIICCEILQEAGLLEQKCIFFILLGFNDTKVLLRYFYILIFCSGRAFQQYIDNDNPTVTSDMASISIFTASNFWADVREDSHLWITRENYPLYCGLRYHIIHQWKAYDKDYHVTYIYRISNSSKSTGTQKTRLFVPRVRDVLTLKFHRQKFFMFKQKVIKGNLNCTKSYSQTKRPHQPILQCCIKYR